MYVFSGFLEQIQVIVGILHPVNAAYDFPSPNWADDVGRL